MTKANQGGDEAMPAFRSERRFAPLLALLAVAGCSDDDAGGARAAAPPPPAVVVAELKAQTVPIFRDFVARTEAVNTVEIQARVEAILVAFEFEEGKPVAKGQVLYRLDESTYKANLSTAQAGLAQAEAELKLASEQVSVRASEANLVEAGARLKKAEQDVARLRPLAEKDAVPRQDLDTALAGEEVARAEVQAKEAALENSRIQEEVGILMATAQVESATAKLALARLDFEYCTISAPIDGLIGRTLVDVGNLVGRGEATALATVSSVDPMYVTFAISEAEYLRFADKARDRDKDNAGPPVDLILADDSTYEHVGRPVTVERAVAKETGTLQIVTSFPNPERKLRPGQFGRIRIQVDTHENAVLLPQRAVMEKQSAKVVFVVGENDVVALRTIQIAERYQDSFIVTDGLKAGERVIIEGQLKARPGSPVKAMDRPVSSEPAISEPESER
jgi:membrane fusion protein (multidrug efflux system)